MTPAEYMAQTEQDYRERVLYPRAERNAQMHRELRLIELENRQAHPRRSPRRWIGDRLVGAGDLLTGLGERLAQTRARTPSPPA